jgi:agmatine/peptidylarginine deiminase
MSTPLLQALGLAFFLTACGQPSEASKPPLSKVDGHYEGKDAADMARYIGKQAAVPEFSPVRAVLVSHQIVKSYGLESFLKALIDSGLPEVHVVVPKTGAPLARNPSRQEVVDAVGPTYASRLRFVEHGSPSGNASTVWARDWAPLFATDSTTGAKRLLDFNYYPRRPVDDAVGTQLELTGWERVSVPVYNEGGNFMNNTRGDCLMTSRVTDANARKYRDDDIVLNASEITRLYADFAGCARTKVFPRMPTEGTGHIDMWAKFLTDDDVLVGEIAESDATDELAKSIRSYLNERAADIEAMGLRVHRIPMPKPSSWVFRSYTNSLLVNGTAFVPQYATDSVHGPRVEAIYQDLGFKVVWVPSDSLIRDGGAVHCVTMQVP